MYHRWIIAVACPAFLAAALAPAALAQTAPREVRPVEIVGQVRFSVGNAPAEHVLVNLERFAGSLVEQVRTDRLGKFKFSGLAPAQYIVIASAPGFVEARENVDTQTTPSVYVMLQLRPRKDSQPEEVIGTIDAKIPELARKEYDKGRDALLKDKKVQEGILHLERAVSAHPDFAEGRLLLGTAYMDSARWDEAERELQRAAEIDPELPAARIALGEVFIRSKRYKEAERILQTALKLDPNSWQAHLALARVYWELGDLAKAGPEVGRAIQIKPDLAEAHLLGGNILLRARQAEQALVMFEEYVRLEPKGQFVNETRRLIDRIKQSFAAIK